MILHRPSYVYITRVQEEIRMPAWLFLDGTSPVAPQEHQRPAKSVKILLQTRPASAGALDRILRSPGPTTALPGAAQPGIHQSDRQTSSLLPRSCRSMNLGCLLVGGSLSWQQAIHAVSDGLSTPRAVLSGESCFTIGQILLPYPTVRPFLSAAIKVQNPVMVGTPPAWAADLDTEDLPTVYFELSAVFEQPVAHLTPDAFSAISGAGTPASFYNYTFFKENHSYLCLARCHALFDSTASNQESCYDSNWSSRRSKLGTLGPCLPALTCYRR